MPGAARLQGRCWSYSPGRRAALKSSAAVPPSAAAMASVNLEEVGPRALWKLGVYNPTDTFGGAPAAVLVRRLVQPGKDS